MTLEQIGIGVFSAVFLITLAVAIVAGDRLSRRNRRLRQRMRTVLEGTQHEDEGAGYVILRDTSYSHIPILDRLLSHLRVGRYLQRLIAEAGLPIKTGTLVLGSLSLAGLVWLLASNFFGGVLLGLIPAGVVGALPYGWVRMKRTQRIERFEELLPEAIDLVVNALKSGFSLEASFSLVGQEIPDPVGSEFAMTFQEQNLGLDLVQALENMSRRVPSSDLKIMTTAISIQKRTGGNLTEILGKISGMIRERSQLRREIKIFTAQGRLSGMILAVMPIAMAGLLSIMNPDYLKILFTDPVGQYLLAGALGLQILGFLAIRRVIRLKV